MKKINRAIVIVLDSVGVGALPDAADFGDEGANTLGNIAREVNGLNLPNLQQMGLGNIIPVEGVAPNWAPTASWGIMKELSRGKDTMAGHWELMGLVVEKPFPTFPDGFPQEILDQFYQATGAVSALGNCAASGTVIIADLGEEHMKTGFPIVYTSADSVFQIAAHEDIIPVEKLYEMCRTTRKICDDFQVGRVIARPFIGKPGDFTRTARRKDFPMVPSGKTALDLLKEKGLPVMGIGKIEDIFAKQGITRAVHTKSNRDGMKCLTEELAITRDGLIFVNLVDFDMLYGHRNDVKGYARSLEEFDVQLGQLLPHLREDDLLIITADHGCDPTFPGTDHTREHIPLLAFSQNFKPRALGTRDTFSDIAVSILDIFDVPHHFPGKSFISE